MKFYKKTALVLFIFTSLITTKCSQKAEDFVPLFDGKTLDGWVIPEKSVPNWKVENGVMLNDGIGPDCGSLIWTEREDYKDFILKVDWRLSGKPKEQMLHYYDCFGDLVADDSGNPVRRMGLFCGDSGVFLRGMRFDKNAPESVQNRFTRAHFNIWSHSLGSGQNHGYMVNKSMPLKIRRSAMPLKNADKPLGEWNTYIIKLIGEDVTVILNEDTVIQMTMPELPEMGAIGLQQHNPGKDADRPYPIEFRNIFIKEL
jgi:hypothetical protein